MYPVFLGTCPNSQCVSAAATMTTTVTANETQYDAWRSAIAVEAPLPLDENELEEEVDEMMIVIILASNISRSRRASCWTQGGVWDIGMIVSTLRCQRETRESQRKMYPRETRTISPTGQGGQPFCM